MAHNNNLLFNAAIAGFMSGALGGRVITSSVASDYAVLKDAALVFADAVDLAIPNDAQIPSGSDDNPSITFNAWCRALLLEQICKSVRDGRYSQDTTPADYTTLAAAVAAAYNETVPAFFFAS